MKRETLEFLMPFFHRFKPGEEDYHSAIRCVQCWLHIMRCVSRLGLSLELYKHDRNMKLDCNVVFME